MLPKDTLNSKIVPEYEIVRLFSICWEQKSVTIDEKTPPKFSWANSVFTKKHWFTISDNYDNNVHIDYLYLIGYYYCLVSAVFRHSPLTAATRVRYVTSACEIVRWSPSQTGGFPPGTPGSSHTTTIRKQTSVPTNMVNISGITCFVIVVK